MDRFLINLAAEHDAGEILAIYAPYVENTAVSFEIDVPRLEDFSERVNKIRSRYPFLVCKKDKKIVGFAYATELMERAAYQWSAALSVYLKDGFTGQGLGAVLYQALMDILRLQNIKSVYGVVAMPNPASEKLHRQLGFRLAGRYDRAGYKCGAWHDVAFFEKHIGLHDDRPEAPKPISEISRDAITAIFRRKEAALHLPES